MNWKKNLLKTTFVLTAVTLGLSSAPAVIRAQDPVETRPPVTEYEPSYPEQTRAPGVATETDYEVNVLTEELESPWGMDELPDNRLVVTQKAGTLVIVSLEDGSVSDPIEGFPEVNDEEQGGLLDVALATDFAESRMLYFTFSEDLEEGTVTSVGRGILSEDETMIEDFEVIFRAEPAYPGPMHYGSRILFDTMGNIYVTTGERFNDDIRDQAQDLTSYLGKIIYLTSDGEPVESNPFTEDEEAMSGIFTYGHRNVQGIDIHPVSGEIWISEMGPQAGDELNLLEAGNNYGWPLVSYGLEYSNDPVNEGETTGDEFTEPIYYWDLSLAPSGMAFYDSDVIAEWENNLFIGGLAGSHIARLVIENDLVVGEERLLEEEEQRFRDIHVGTDGALYAITDNGLLYQLKMAESESEETTASEETTETEEAEATEETEATEQTEETTESE